jgi:hypothetical protein
MNPTLLAVLTIVGVVLGAVSTILHFVAPKTKTTVDDRVVAAIDEIKALLAKLVPPALVLILVGASLLACSAGTREKTISTTLTAITAADHALVTFDREHQLDIVAHAPDKATAKDELAAYRDGRDKVKDGLTGAYRAVAVAATVNNDQTLAAMLQAASILEQELKELVVMLP